MSLQYGDNMLDTAYTLTVQFTAKHGKEQALTEVLMALVGSTRQAAGCLLYTLHQCPDDKTQFLIYEAWVDKAAHTLYGQTPPIQAWRQKREQLVAHCKVTRWQALKQHNTALA